MSEVNNHRDRAAGLKIIGTVPEDDYNREVDIEAKSDGLWIENCIFIPWDWLNQAMRLCSEKERPFQ